MRQQISVPDLANIAGMSASTFHEHFKNLTATSPLQYQKNLSADDVKSLIVNSVIENNEFFQNNEKFGLVKVGKPN